MKKTKQNKEKKINLIKITFVVIIFLIIFCYAVGSIIKLLKNPTNTLIVKEGTISKEETDIGYIIRNEEIVKGQNYKNGMERIVEEGQKVAKNESIFRYYSNGEEDIKKQLEDLDKQIETAMNSQEEQLFSSDTKLLDTKIDETLLKINKLNDIQSIQESKKNISDYIMKKAEIVGELSPKGSKIKELINQRTEVEKKLTTGSEYIRSPNSGILSYKIDGLEETLNTKDFSAYNKKFLDGLNLKTGKIISSSSEQGKIVNNFNCYIATTSKSEEANNAKEGDKVTLVLPSAREIKAKIEKINRESDNEVTLVLSFSEGIDELINYRKVSFEIVWWNSKGYKIPNSAIITENNLNYVIRNKAGYLEKVLVKEVKKTDNYSIVSNYSVTDFNDLNVNKKAKTSISLYDEIILNPTEDQIKSTE